MTESGACAIIIVDRCRTLLEKFMKQENADGVRQIRYYIFNTIRKHPTESVRLPSSYELAQMFHTTRRAAQWELERQVRKGVLTTRHRVGTFTLPTRESLQPFQQTGVLPLIGVCFGNGDHFYYGQYDNALFSAVFGALSRHQCLAHDLRINLDSEEERFREIRALGIDAVLWCGVADWMETQGERFFHHLTEAGIPAGNFAGKFWDSASGVDFSFRKALHKLKKHLLREGRRKIAVRTFPKEAERFREELHEIFQESDFEITEWCSTDPIPENYLPDVLFFKKRSMKECERFFADAETAGGRNGPRCLPVSLDPFFPPGFRGLYFEFPYQEAAGQLVEELLARIGHPEQPNFRRLWEAELKEM